jgi:hypothetical protein
MLLVLVPDGLRVARQYLRYLCVVPTEPVVCHVLHYATL